MKRAILIWLFAMTFMAAISTAQTATPAQFTLAISEPHSTIKAGAKVTIHIGMTNTSDKPIGLRALIQDYGYIVDLTVVDNGTAALDTERGRQWKKDGGTRQLTSGPIVLLKPGETRKGSLVISDLYDLTHPGKYSVQVRRGTVKSNTITVAVVP